MKRLLHALLEPSRRVAVITTLGMVLLAPSLTIGFMLDDHTYLAAVEGRLALERHPLDLFSFITPETNADLVREGHLPWWTHPGLKARLFRPLSSALMWLDYSLFGRHALGYQLHSFLWFAALLLIWGRMLGRLVPGRIAGLALLIYAVDDAHLLPAAWIANRNAVVAAVPALLGLWAHLRYREEGWRPGRPLSLLGLALGLAGGEAAVGVMAYVLSYELLAAPGGWRERLAAIAPAVGLGVVYLVVYRALGYGFAGSGVYHDPLGSPAAFAANVALNLPTLLAGGLLGVPVMLAFLIPVVRIPFALLGLAGVGVLWIPFRNAIRALAPERQRSVRWLLGGAVLSLLPMAATLPHDRLLLVPFLGGSVVIAVFLAHAWDRVTARPRQPGRGRIAVVGALLAAAHLALSPLALVGLGSWMGVQTRKGEAVALALEVRPEVRDIVLLSAPDFFVGMYVPIIRASVGRPLPSWRLISIAPAPHHARRTGPRTLELSVEKRHLLVPTFAMLFRTPDAPLEPGTRVTAGPLEVEILETRDGGPSRVALHFDRALEDPTLAFLFWREGALVEAPPPAIGEDLRIPWTPGPTGM